MKHLIITIWSKIKERMNKKGESRTTNICNNCVCIIYIYVLQNDKRK